MSRFYDGGGSLCFSSLDGEEVSTESFRVLEYSGEGKKLFFRVESWASVNRITLLTEGN